MSNSPNYHAGDTLLLHRFQLVITWPDGNQQTYTLGKETLRIGRGAENNDIIVPAGFSSISRDHLELRREGTLYQAIDLGSANGTFINGSLITQSILLQDGDEISIGAEPNGELVKILYRAIADASVMESDPGHEVIPAPVQIIFQAKPPANCPFLKIHWPTGIINYFAIENDSTLIGRDSQASLRVPASLIFVSKFHAEIRRTDRGFRIIDLGSTNGTRLNNTTLPPHEPLPLTHDSIIRIGDEHLGNSIGLTFQNPTEVQFKVSGFSPSAVEPTRIINQRVIFVGREVDCDIMFPSPSVSRKHALIRQDGDNYWIEDLKSTNGTFVNGQAITQTEKIYNGDLITIGPHLLVFHDGQLEQFHSYGMRVDVTTLSKDVKTRSGPLRILHNIHMTVLPREFLALVGGSGAGKSTLINALIGIRPGEGMVQLNGHDLYKEIEHFRSQLGYVPQFDILHSSLTVEKALNFTARLRMPADVSAVERSRRIAEVLETVSMNTNTIRQTRISNLSGGQRKRVSIAAELLADPKLIFLDEATSGLDPGLEKKMMNTLRRMADEGRTVILITHATANIVQTDQVAFLSQGRLVFYGSSKDALDFFEVDSFADIYERIERHGEEWQNVFHNGKLGLYQRYITERQESKPPALERNLPRIRFGIADAIRQFIVLTQRTLAVLTSDWFTLMLMLLLLPLTAMLQLIISTPEILTGNLVILADPVQAAKTMTEGYIPFPDLNVFIFVMGLEAVLVGMYVTSNELIKDRTIYLRERMVNLKLLPYLFSKVAVFTIFAAVQPLLYLIVLSFGVDFPDQGLYMWAPAEIFITMFLTVVATMSMGFVVSAISKSNDVAIYILVLLIFFQFFFAGAVFDLRDNPAKPLSYLTATRWSLIALGVTIGFDEQVEATVLCNTFPDNPQTPQNEVGKLTCFNYPDATEDLMLPYEDRNLLRSWVVLIAMAILALVATGVLIKRLDTI